ncbi:MAG: hypothetical protein MI756_00105, partial [Chromatiales bacterium]|nr:hypothetical protein [Chromatiales bacterium]
KEAEQYGIGESNLTARLPLMVRPSAPRFLNFGDRFELPVVVQNQSDRDLEVRVAAEAANATFTAGLGRRVVVPAKDRVEVLLPAKTDLAGKARFRIAAVSGKAADAAMIEVPVWTPATSEAFAVYGEIDESGAIAQPVAVPDDVFPQFGGLEVTTTSTALHTLTDAVLYLTNYPYDCAEQRASRIMGIVTLEKVLREFGADLDPDKLRAVVEKDVEALSQTQNGDGGFGFWRRGEKSWPYLSIHVAHALIRARQHDVSVPDRVLKNCKRYLRLFERDNFPRDWSKRSQFMVKAYALYVRALDGDRQPRHADKVLAMMPIEDAPMEGLGWLLSVYKPQSESARKLLRHFNNRADETAATAQFTDHYGDDAYLILHSSRRTDAVILEGLIGAQRNNPLIPKVVAGLLGHRTKGRWTNTQENAFVLLAIKRYFDTYEATTPDFVARVWLGEAFAGEHAYRGRSAERHQVDIPMAWLTEQTGDSADLIVDKQGAGRLYYRLGMNYAPRDLNL